MKTVAIIQARLGSSRLPGKVLMELAGKPVIRWVYDRAKLIKGVDEVVVATSDSKKDDPLATYCTGQEVPIFRGSEGDVLDRYIQAARSRNSDRVMRITGDCPFVDPQESGKVLQLFLDTEKCDYASNIAPPFLPDGLDTEVASMSALERVWRDAESPRYREHVTLYMLEHPDKFHVASLAGADDYSSQRWTLDYPEDYDMLTAVADKLSERGEFGSLEEIRAILKSHPEIGAMNASRRRNEALEL